MSIKGVTDIITDISVESLGGVVGLVGALVFFSMPIAIVVADNYRHGQYWQFFIVIGLLLAFHCCSSIYQFLRMNDIRDETEIEREDRKEKALKEGYRWLDIKHSTLYRTFHFAMYELGFGIYLILLGMQIAWFQTQP